MGSGPDRAEVTIGAKIDEAVGALASLESRFTEFSRHATEKIDLVGKASEHLLDKIKEVAIGWLSWEAGKKIIEETITASEHLGLEMGRLSATLGVSTEEASALRLALGDIGVSTDTYVGALQRLTLHVRENEERLNALGVVTRDSNGQFLDAEKLIANAGKALLEFRAGTDRNLASTEMFGRGWAQVQEILRLNDAAMAEARDRAKELGLAIGPEQVRRAREYQKAMSEMKDVAEGVGNAFGQELLVQLTHLGEWVGEHGGKLLEWARDYLDLSKRIAEAWRDNPLFLAIPKALGIIGGRDPSRSSGGKIGGVFGEWSGPVDQYGQPISGRSYSPKPTGSLMQEWETQLARMRLAYQQAALEQGEFAKYPLEKEIEFWSARIDLTKAKSKERFEVERKMYEAQLALNLNNFNAEIANLVKAQEAQKYNYDERIRIAQQVADKETAAYGTQSVQAQIALAKVVQLKQEQAEQLAKINEQIVENERSAGLARVAVAEEEAKRDFDLRSISRRELTSALQLLESERYQIERTAAKAKIDAIEALPGNLQNPVELARRYAELEKLDIAHAKNSAQIAADGARESARFQVDALTSVEQAFATFISNTASRTRTLQGAFLDLGLAIERAVIQMIALQAAQQIVGPGTFLGSFFGGIFGKIGSTLAGPNLLGETGTFGALLAFDTGTPYVPRNMVAKIHEGEAVIPKEANPFAGGSGLGGDTIIFQGVVDAQQFFAKHGDAMMSALKGRNRNFGVKP